QARNTFPSFQILVVARLTFSQSGTRWSCGPVLLLFPRFLQQSAVNELRLVFRSPFTYPENRFACEDARRWLKSSEPVAPGGGWGTFPEASRRFPSDMAEYSQTGILTALLLFTVVTVRDIYLGRSAVDQTEQQKQAAEGMGSDGFLNPDIHTQRQTKPKFYTGPVLRFQYCIS
uniref:Uncharacterized protein n=1 Tax=Pygocentrus nattereri TaxID=42514 RepID=A0A3B4EE18_PYGNA